MARGEKGRKRPWRNAANGVPGQSTKIEAPAKNEVENGAEVSDRAVKGADPNLLSEVASFAASLGLASGGGFDDSDFRKPAQSIQRQGKESKGKQGKEVKGHKEAKGVQGQKNEKEATKARPNRETSQVGNGVKKAEEVEGEDWGKLASFAPVADAASVGPWYQQIANLEGKVNLTKKGKKKSGQEWGDLLQTYRQQGQELLQREADLFEKGQAGGPAGKDAQWLASARRSGTSADKVAAMTVLLQEHPIGNLRSLDALLGMVTVKGGKRQAAVAMDSLKELFLTSLLPDRKLKPIALRKELADFQEDSSEWQSLLMLYYYEDCLKERYEKFVSSLDIASRDTLPFLKEKALKTVYDLLVEKPEQEAKLLSILVNKLGDPERKVASKAGYLLGQLLDKHPNMKLIVVTEVDSFVFRPNVGLRAKYYAAVFLNQIVLYKKGDGPQLARKLIDLYFALFKVLNADEAKPIPKPSKHPKKPAKPFKNKKKDKKGAPVEETESVGMDSRLLSALLTGVNRAFPFVAATDADKVIEEHTPALFRMVHAGSLNVAVQALLLLHQLMTAHQAVSQRFYRALYSVLLSPNLTKSSKTALFLSVLFKALKADLDSKRIAAFAKRLLQVAAHQSPVFACGSLLLLSEVLKLRPVLWGAVQQPEDKGEDLEHFKDVPEEDSPAGAPPPQNPPLETPPSESDTDSDTALAGDFTTADSDDEKSAPKTIHPPEPKVHPESPPRGLEGAYDPRKRDPAYAAADRACWWELTVLAAHSHPSVAAMARTLLAGASVVYAGDPLRDLSLGVFLDKFVEKKPKALKKAEDGSTKWKGSSLMQPLRRTDDVALAMNAEAFKGLEEGQVAAADVFFFRYYSAKTSQPKKRKKKGKEEEEDEEPEEDGKESKKQKREEDEEDEEIENVESDDEALESILAGGPDELEGGEEAPLEGPGEWDYDNLGAVLARAGEGDQSDEEEEDEEGSELDSDVEPEEGLEEDEEIGEGVEGDGSGSELDMDENAEEKPSSQAQGKSKRQKGVSPFAAAEDFEHVLGEGQGHLANGEQKGSGRKRRKGHR